MCGAFAQVPSQKAKSFGCFGHCSIYMFVPCEVVCHVYTELLSTVYQFQCVSVEPVGGLSLEALHVDVNSDDLTLLRVELHLPLCLNSSSASTCRSSCSLLASSSVLKSLYKRSHLQKGGDRSG